MKKVVFVVVNYGGLELTKNCYDSVAKFSDHLEVEFLVVDNFSTHDERKNLAKAFDKSPAKIIFLDENVGYFRAINVGLLYARKSFENVDLYIVGNNDLEFPIEFLEEIQSLSGLDDEVIVVSPSITNLKGDSQNPHSVYGITRAREFAYTAYYSNRYVAKLILNLTNIFSGVLRRKDQRLNNSSKFIKLGFGACYLIRPDFFKFFEALWAPVFLMGEELMFSRQLNTRGKKIYFKHDIHVKHLDNATIRDVPSQIIWSSAKKSHMIYRRFVNPFNWQLNSNVDRNWIVECSGTIDCQKAQERLQNANVFDCAVPK